MLKLCPQFNQHVQTFIFYIYFLTSFFYLLNIRFRAEVIAKNPLKVKYIDYGNINIEPLEEVKKIDTAQLVEQQAIKVRVSGKLTEVPTEGDELCLKVISKVCFFISLYSVY